MADSLAKRVGRIISASINAVVDAVEDAAPEMVMEQAVNEIDNAIYEVRAELGKVIASKHLANKRMAEKNYKYEDLSAKIEVAVAEGRDDLAEAAISHQLDIEAQIPVLENTITDAGEREKELEGYISALQAKKREMKDELKSFRENMKKTTVETHADGTYGAGQGSIEKMVDEATSAFDNVLERQTGLGGISATDRKVGSQLAELEQLSRDNRVKERLAAIKSSKKE
jgi:phage shock protein A